MTRAFFGRCGICGILSFAFSYWGAEACTAQQYEHTIFRAARRSDELLLQSVLREGAPVDLRIARGDTPLMTAALHGNAKMVKLLLDHGADPNATNKIGATPLLWSAGDIEKVRLLLDKGADINARSKLGNTPLIVAAAFGESAEVVKLLLENGAKVQVKNSRGVSPLRSAVSAGDAATVKRLLAHPKINRSKNELANDLSAAAGRGYQGIVEILLEHGAKPNLGSGRNALNGALLAQKPAIARMLLEKGAVLDRRLSPGGVPSIVLSAYTETGDTSVAQLMIECGANLDEKSEYDETVLTWARKRGDPQLIDLLVKSKAPEAPSFSEEVKIPEREVQFDADNHSHVLREAVEKSVALLQQGSDGFFKKRENCVSCHHQNLPSLAIGWARDRGLTVNEKSIQKMIDGQLRSWRPRIDRAYQMDRPVPVPPRFIGYGLLGFAALGYPPDEVTQAMSWYLAGIQQADGHWTPGMLRPPVGGGDIVATVLAIRSLQLYPLEGQREKTAERIDRARRWLKAAQPQIHQQRVYKLLGLGWAGTPVNKLQDAVKELLDEQRGDGGWAQLPHLSSDAWATGQTLVALHIAGGAATSHPAYHRGLEFLVRTQFDDGSWYVPTRTWPFQSHFESEFPHGRDQWVSAPATAWAAMAMILAIEPLNSKHESTKVVSAGKTSKRSVDFVRDIQPILRRSCVGCHSGAKPKGEFQVTTRASLLKGGATGEAAVKPGDSEESPLLRYISDLVDEMEMPPLAKRDKFPALTSEEIANLRKWIERGAPWPKDVVIAKSE